MWWTSSKFDVRKENIYNIKKKENFQVFMHNLFDPNMLPCIISLYSAARREEDRIQKDIERPSVRTTLLNFLELYSRYKKVELETPSS